MWILIWGDIIEIISELHEVKDIIPPRANSGLLPQLQYPVMRTQKDFIHWQTIILKPWFSNAGYSKIAKLLPPSPELIKLRFLTRLERKIVV